MAKFSLCLPEVSPEKLITFDSNASAVDPAAITEAPDICFVDGENTNTAVVSDFHFCLRVARSDAIIVMHDAGILAEGLRIVRRELDMKGIPHVRLMLAGSVYAIALGKSASAWRDECAAPLQDEERHSRASAFYLRRLCRESRLRRWPFLLHCYRGHTATLDWVYRRGYHPLQRIVHS